MKIFLRFYRFRIYRKLRCTVFLFLILLGLTPPPSLFSTEARVERDGVFLPLLMDAGKIITNPESRWRDKRYEIFRWEKLYNVLIFDTTNYSTQARFFKRIAFFAEKKGYAGKILSDQELLDKRGYRAHNYSAYDLAFFFNSAGNAVLNEEELLLREILEVNNIIFKINKTYHPVKGGLIAVTRGTISPRLRRYLFIHELHHAMFYSLTEYRKGVLQTWNSLNPLEKEFWVLFLTNRGYDTGNEGLVVNEFHAYVLQQLENSFRMSFINQAMSEITGSFSGRTGFQRNFAAGCGNCLVQTFRTLVGELKKAGREAGFNYFDYIEALKEF